MRLSRSSFVGVPNSHLLCSTIVMCPSLRHPLYRMYRDGATRAEAWSTPLAGSHRNVNGSQEPLRASVSCYQDASPLICLNSVLCICCWHSGLMPYAFLSLGIVLGSYARHRARRCRSASRARRFFIPSLGIVLGSLAHEYQHVSGGRPGRAPSSCPR